MQTSELKALVERLADAKAIKEGRDAEAKAANETYQGLKAQVLDALQATELDKFTTDNLTVSVVDKSSVRVPQDREAKEAFFKYLTERGIYWEYVSVNSQKLNSFYKEEERIQLAAGNIDFKVPGIDGVTTYQELSVRSR